MIKRLRRRQFKRIDGRLYRAQLVRRLPGKPDEFRWVPVKKEWWRR